MQREQADQLINQLGLATDLPLALDEAGTCLLALDDDSVVSFGYEPNRERLVLFAPLERIEPSEAVMRTMLSANFLWYASDGATFALNPGGDVALLHLALPDDIDVPGLQTAFEAFVKQVQFWNQHLSSLQTNNADAQTSAPSDPLLVRA